MTKAAPSSNTPPRPLNCFLLYRNDKQKEITAKCSGANHRDISKIIAKWWKEASADEKAYYRKRAEDEKEEHRRLYPEYKYSPKKKSGPKRVYTRRRIGNTFTSKLDDNNELMERIYENPEILKDLKDQEKVPVIHAPKKTPSSTKRSYTARAKKSSLLCSNSDPKGYYSRENAASFPIFYNNYQGPAYFQSMTEVPTPRTSPCPSTISSIGSVSPFTTPSPSSTYRTLPYAYSTTTTASSTYENVNGSKMRSQEQIYPTYYRPNCDYYSGAATYSSEAYVSNFHSTSGNASNNNRYGYMDSTYSSSSSATTLSPYHHHSSTTKGLSYSYFTPVGTGTYDYEEEAEQCINPSVLGML